MNPHIRKRLKIQKPRDFYPSFRMAAEGWGDHVSEGLTFDDREVILPMKRINGVLVLMDRS